jgi:hypothetical protein
MSTFGLEATRLDLVDDRLTLKFRLKALAQSVTLLRPGSAAEVSAARTITGAWLLRVVCDRCSRPRFVGAQSKEPRPSAATMRRRPAQPADPVPPARAPQSPDEERSGRQLCPAVTAIS